MNSFKAIYCNQYYELLPQGKAHSTHKLGTILNTLVLILFVFSAGLLLYVFIPDFEDVIMDPLKKWFGRRNGKLVGKFLGVIIMFICYPIIRYTVGSTNSYDNTIKNFNSLHPIEKEKISKKGMQFFYRSFLILIISIVLAVLKNLIV